MIKNTIALNQGSLNISSRGPYVDFFGSPWAKVKKTSCEKQLINLINNCKESQDLFCPQIIVISKKKCFHLKSVAFFPFSSQNQGVLLKRRSSPKFDNYFLQLITVTALKLLTLPPCRRQVRLWAFPT